MKQVNIHTSVYTFYQSNFTFLAKLLNFTLTKDVVEGEHANFSCTVKHGKGSVLWKIGDYTREDGNSFDNPENEQVSVEVYDQVFERMFGSDGETNGIGLLATEELDGVPVQCVMVPYKNHAPKEYSRFSISMYSLQRPMKMKVTQFSRIGYICHCVHAFLYTEFQRDGDKGEKAQEQT